MPIIKALKTLNLPLNFDSITNAPLPLGRAVKALSGKGKYAYM
jgi:hypothetical protein